MMKPKPHTVITLGARCENSCFFCGRNPRGDSGMEGIKKLLSAGKKQGCEKLVLEGLEPTSDPDFKNAALTAVRLGFAETRLETNGIRLSGAGFTAQLTLAGITEVCVMLPSSDATTYGRITGNPGGYEKCIQGIRNSCATCGIRTSIRVPVCAENHDLLPDILRLAFSLGIRAAVLDVGTGYKFWPAGGKKEIMKSIETAVVSATSIGVSIGLKGGDIFQADSYKDGRLEKKAGGDACLLTYYRPGRAGKREIFSADFRLTYRCNQRCLFCAAEREFREPSTARIKARLDTFLRSNVQRICFEGGEPTLFPQLPEFIEKASHAGVREITVMTNAVRSADRTYAAKLVSAGVSRVFVSLHACEPALSEAITRAPGTFRNTIDGIHNFLTLGARTYLIFVMLPTNIETLPEYIRFVHSEFGEIPVLLSMVTPYIDPTLTAKLIPSYTEMRPVLDEAAAVAARLHVPLSAMEEQHRPPDCVLGGARLLFRNLFAPIVRGTSAAEGFIKPAMCRRCDANSSCPGVREFYSRAHGTQEISPLRRTRAKK